MQCDPATEENVTHILERLCIEDLLELVKSTFADEHLEGAVLQVWSSEFGNWIDVDNTLFLEDKMHVTVVRPTSRDAPFF